MSTPNGGTTVTVTKTSQLEAAGLAGYSKAIAAFVAVAVAMLAKALADGSITGAEWRDLAISSVSAGLAAYAADNRVKDVEVAVPPTPRANIDGQ
jgi:hypothetical protein